MNNREKTRLNEDASSKSTPQKSLVPMLTDSDASETEKQRAKALREYLDEVLPAFKDGAHPFLRFHISEIVVHSEFGTGVVTGYRMPDLEREFEGLGVQFVVKGRMTVHKVFTPSESSLLKATGLIFDVKMHTEMTLEEVLETKIPE